MQRGVRCVRGLIPTEECRRCALDPLHPCHFTPDMLESMRGGQVEPDTEDEDADDPGAFTPSRLLGCDRRAGLEMGHDTWLDVKSAYKLYRGHMVHHQHESNREYPGAVGTIREMRFKTEVQTSHGPQRFTGKPDLVVVKDIRLDGDKEIATLKVVDYKSTGEIKHQLTAPYRHHVMQVNMYAWLVAKELPRHMNRALDVVVDELEILYEDMNRPRRFTSAGTLTDQGKRIVKVQPTSYETLVLDAIPLVPMEQVQAWITKHIEARIKATTQELPPPLEGEAAWICRFCPLYQVCHELAEKEIA